MIISRRLHINSSHIAHTVEVVAKVELLPVREDASFSLIRCDTPSSTVHVSAMVNALGSMSPNISLTRNRDRWVGEDADSMDDDDDTDDDDVDGTIDRRLDSRLLILVLLQLLLLLSRRASLMMILVVDADLQEKAMTM